MIPQVNMLLITQCSHLPPHSSRILHHSCQLSSRHSNSGPQLVVLLLLSHRPEAPRMVEMYRKCLPLPGDATRRDFTCGAGGPFRLNGRSFSDTLPTTDLAVLGKIVCHGTYYQNISFRLVSVVIRNYAPANRPAPVEEQPRCKLTA